jgi:hypothetical protein
MSVKKISSVSGQVISMMKFTHLFWMIGLLWSYNSHATNSSYLTELITQAQKQEIAKDLTWLRLVHYRPNLFNGYASEASNPYFFLAPDGPSNPEAELIATLRSLFSPPNPQTDDHAQCRFIARHNWLRERLHIDHTHLPAQPCSAFNTWYREINPGSITLVFPSAYINSPASMFGHTLFRIDPQGQYDNSRLFSYAINFAANTDETNGLVFAFKGLTGLYPGGFSLMPYYDKVQKYAEIENRDMWEYELNLQESEIRRILEHLWELRQVPFPYYFFNKNCSYQLLTLLEIARPTLSLTDRFRYWAIPSDTVRAILEDDTILQQVVYRPSDRKKIEALRNHMDETNQTLALDLAHGKFTTDDQILETLPVTEKTATLELAYRYLRYQYTQNQIDQDISAQRSLALLSERSKLPVETVSASIDLPTRPDTGHRSARIALGVGRKAQRNYGLIRLRPAYHDLLDNKEGYSAGAQINFFDLTLHYSPSKTLRLEDLTFLDVTSISPRDRFFQSISWHVDTGYGRKLIPAQPVRERVPYLNAGAGLAYSLGEDSVIAAFAESSAMRHSSLQHHGDVALGASARWLWQASQQINVILSASHLRWHVSHSNATEYKLGVNWAFHHQWALRYEAYRIDNEAQEYRLAQLSLQHYF